METHSELSTALWCPAAQRGPLRWIDNDGSSLIASATTRCARSRSSSGYFLGAGMTPPFRGIRLPTRPGAIQDSVVGDGRKAQALIDRHSDKPMTPTTVSMEMMVSSVWWTVEIGYVMPGQEPFSEHVLVHPRTGSPDRPMDYVVDPAP